MTIKHNFFKTSIQLHVSTSRRHHQGNLTIFKRNIQTSLLAMRLIFYTIYYACIIWNEIISKPLLVEENIRIASNFFSMFLHLWNSVARLAW
jgi:hypothetical protein